MKKLVCLIPALFFLFAIISNAQIINIPADYPTIQQGIDDSQDGDTVLVQPGIYYENIIYNGKNITVCSLFLLSGNDDYIEQTIIDGNANGLPCVRIMNGETNNAKLIGFTIQNGYTASDGWGPAIHIGGSSPILDYLIIKNNNDQTGWNTHGCVFAGGADCYPIIKNSLFINNMGRSAFGNWTGNPTLINCIFTENLTGAVGIFGDGTLINCLMYDNFGSNATLDIVGDNVFLINTTISNNHTFSGLALTTGDPRIINTIISGNDNYNVYIQNGVAYIDYSLIEFGPDSVYKPDPADLQWGDHNLISSPGFKDVLNNDYSLSDCSIAIGSGINSVVLFEQLLVAPDFDITNGLRPLPAGSIPDIGAYENALGVPFIPPTITIQPIGASLCEGISYTLYVQATGSPEITFQWQKNNLDIPGETSDTLQLINLTLEDEANYRCLVTNSCETKYSNQAHIEVKEYPDVTSLLQDEILYFGNNAQFTVGAIGDEPLSYQWYGPIGLLENDTLSQILITSVSADDVGDYYCTITNVCGSATSNSATLTAYDQLTIDAGMDVTLMLGDSTMLNGSSTGGSPSLTIHWTPDTLLYDPNILITQTIPLFSSQAFTLTVNDFLVGYQTSDEVFITVIEDDTLAFFGDEDDTLYNYITRGYCGYISGNNCDLDKIKANYFTDPMISYDVEKVLLRFGKAVKTTADEVPVKIGIWAKSTENDKPGDLIDYINVSLSQIVQDVEAGNLTSVSFEPNVAAPKDFFVGVFLPTSVGDTLALMTNIDGESEAGLAWTLNAANEWLSYSSDPRFFLRVSNAIFPVVRQNNVGINEPDVSSGEYLIYPNPVNNILYICSRNYNASPGEVIFYDFQGRMIIKKHFTLTTSLDLQGIDQGIYMLIIREEKKVENYKVIVY